eukprot:gb/GECG01004716.1/.p1 GENE.gb/GECG01004716.1/~~gb/GECG01004716.1/.p1  ORF type:complete len:152 (+),score=16.19 gb/GECG01004716.1/:1-456(+)
MAMQVVFLERLIQTQKKIEITNSVYNGNPMIGQDDFGSVVEKGNSNNLTDIVGTVYCPNPSSNECWDDETIWVSIPDRLPILRFQQEEMLSSPSPSSSSTPSPTTTPTVTITPTPSPSASSSTSPRPTGSRIEPKQLPVQYPPRTVIIPHQ